VDREGRPVVVLGSLDIDGAREFIALLDAAMPMTRHWPTHIEYDDPDADDQYDAEEAAGVPAAAQGTSAVVLAFSAGTLR
jgi:hypothetical protein